MELLVAGAMSGSAFFHRGSDSGTSLISMAISTALIVSLEGKLSLEGLEKRNSLGLRGSGRMPDKSQPPAIARRAISTSQLSGRTSFIVS